MKKTGCVLLVIIIFSLFICSCAIYRQSPSTALQSNETKVSATVSEAESSIDQPSQPTLNINTEIGKVKVDWVYYETLDEFIEKHEQIFIGSITEISAPMKVSYSEIGYKSQTGFDADKKYTLVLPYKIQIKEVVKGQLKPGETITINQVVMYYTADQILKSQVTHLFFIKGKPDVWFDSLRQYVLAAPMVGYPKIIDGKLSVYEGNNLFKDGQPIDDVLAQIRDAIQK